MNPRIETKYCKSLQNQIMMPVAHPGESRTSSRALDPSDDDVMMMMMMTMTMMTKMMMAMMMMTVVMMLMIDHIRYPSPNVWTATFSS